jgi:hypothetical protein
MPAMLSSSGMSLTDLMVHGNIWLQALRSVVDRSGVYLPRAGVSTLFLNRLP